MTDDKKSPTDGTEGFLLEARRYLGAGEQLLLIENPEEGLTIDHVHPASMRADIVITAGDKTLVFEVAGKPTMAPLVIPPPSAVVRAQRVLFWLEMLAPRRISSEEVGDALETIAKMEALGCSPWQIRLKVWSTILWVLLNAVREVIAGLTGRKSPHK